MGSLRVISGTAKGRKLHSVPGDTTRPITDRVKESLFNIVGGDIINASLLDLFAGTGSVGIEALSRGAKFVRFIDINTQAIKTIKFNLANTELVSKAEVHRKDAFVYIHSSVDREFDYVYIAPPQYKDLWKRALLSVDANINWLASDGWVIVQIHPLEYRDEPESGYLNRLIKFDDRKYGSTLLLFYQRVGEREQSNK